jgi:hypothetical protein
MSAYHRTFGESQTAGIMPPGTIDRMAELPVIWGVINKKGTNIKKRKE